MIDWATEGTGVIDCADTSPPRDTPYADMGDGCSVNEAGDPAREGISRPPETPAEANPFVCGP